MTDPVRAPPPLPASLLQPSLIHILSAAPLFAVLGTGAAASRVACFCFTADHILSSFSVALRSLLASLRPVRRPQICSLRRCTIAVDGGQAVTRRVSRNVSLSVRVPRGDSGRRGRWLPRRRRFLFVCIVAAALTDGRVRFLRVVRVFPARSASRSSWPTVAVGIRARHLYQQVSISSFLISVAFARLPLRVFAVLCRAVRRGGASVWLISFQQLLLL